MKYDVVIVGAGPSGSTAAKTLAEQGISVLLVDRVQFPRDKTCGGGLPLRTLSRFPYIKELNVIESYSYGGIVYSPSLQYKVEITKSEPVVAMVLRSKFDNALVNLSIENGADFQDKIAVTTFKIHQNHAQIFFNDGTSMSTKLIIGADGFYSTIARSIGFPSARKEKGICILEEFPVTTKTIENLYTRNHICHIFSKIQGIRGYGWVFPKQNHINVGIVSYDNPEQMKQKKCNLRGIFFDYLSFLQRQNVLPREITSVRRKGGSLPVQPLPLTYSERVLLCGDAAGLINPISGEGIYYALVSGALAGKVATDSIQQGDTTAKFLSTYERQWKQDFGKEITLFLRSTKQWGKQGNNIVKLMSRDPQFAELIFLIIIGKESAYDLRWKLIKRYIYRSLLHRNG